jgi:DNA-directed RNA polymerase specialized sigma24 family protein
MANQLTQTKKNGDPYRRPDSVEANIDGALNQSLDVIRGRLVKLETETEFLMPECIVHLLRQALDHDDEERVSILYESLLRRVERILANRIPDGSIRDAEDLRLEVIHDLNVLLAEKSKSLDFYEVAFNRALRNLYVQKIRPARKRPVPIALEDQDAAPDHAGSLLDSSDLSLDLVSALRALPAEERDAILLIECGYEIESIDPQKTTVATICGVTGRTIRARLARAKETLAESLKDHNS